MKISNLVFIVLLVSMLSAGCERGDLIPERMAGPSIYLKSFIDTDELKLSAGVDRYKGNSMRLDFYPYRFWGGQIIRDSSLENNVTFSIGNHEFPYSDSIEDLTRSIKNGQYAYFGGSVLKPSHVLVNLIYNKDSYESSVITQPTSSFFDISNVKDTSYNGQLYKIAEIEFDCMCLSQLSSEVVNFRGKARLAFSNN